MKSDDRPAPARSEEVRSRAQERLQLGPGQPCHENVLLVNPVCLLPHPLNHQIYEERADPDFVESLRTHGVLQPLIVTAGMRILAGHRRWQAAKLLGLEQVPVVVATVPNETVSLIELNRYRQKTTGERMREARILEAELSRLAADRRREGAQRGGLAAGRRAGGGEEVEPNHVHSCAQGAGSVAGAARPAARTRTLVAESIGMSHETLRKVKYVLDSTAATPELKKQLEEDAVSANRAYRQTLLLEERARAAGAGEVARYVPKVVRGDAVAKLQRLESGTVGLVVLDPPLPRNRKPSNENISQMDVVSMEDYCRLVQQTLGHVRRLLAPGGSVFIFAEPLLINRLLSMARGVGLMSLTVLSWVREQGPRNDVTGWVSAWTPILHVAPSRVGAWNAGRSEGRRNVLAVTGKSRQSGVERPVELLRQLVEIGSHPGDIVVDPFAGSGSTGEAAYLTGRRSMLVEANINYVKAIRRRVRRLRTLD